MNRMTTVLIVAVACASARVAEGATTGPGPVGFDEAAACYNPVTGEIVVSVNDMEVWRVESLSNSLTGDAAIFPIVPNVINSDNDTFVGQSVFSSRDSFTYFDHNLGPIAAKSLPLSDLFLAFSPNFGPTQIVSLTLFVPEPVSLGMMLGCIVFFARFHRMPRQV